MEGPGGAHRVHVELRRIFGMPAILRHGSRLGGRLDGMVKMWQGSNESIMSQLREHYIWEVDVCTHTHTHHPTPPHTQALLPIHFLILSAVQSPGNHACTRRLRPNHLRMQEMNVIKQRCGDEYAGVYVLPCFTSVWEWHGVICVRSGKTHTFIRVSSL